MGAIVTHNNNTPPRPEDTEVPSFELAISVVLRGGVVTSLILILLGTVLTYINHPSFLSSGQDLAGLLSPKAGSFPNTVGRVLFGISAFQGRAVTTLGLLTIIATPVIRVAFSLLMFVYLRDRIFSLLTAIVLSILLLSFLLGTV